MPHPRRHQPRTATYPPHHWPPLSRALGDVHALTSTTSPLEALEPVKDTPAAAEPEASTSRRKPRFRTMQRQSLCRPRLAQKHVQFIISRNCCRVQFETMLQKYRLFLCLSLHATPPSLVSISNSSLPPRSATIATQRVKRQHQPSSHLSQPFYYLPIVTGSLKFASLKYRMRCPASLRHCPLTRQYSSCAPPALHQSSTPTSTTNRHRPQQLTSNVRLFSNQHERQQLLILAMIITNTLAHRDSRLSLSSPSKSPSR